MTIAQAFEGVLAANQPIPDGVDGGRLALVMLKGGTTYEQLRASLGAAMQDYNEEMVTAYGDMFYPTKDIAVIYPNGGSLPTIPISSGDARAVLYRGNSVGHMIDRKVHGPIGIGGDWRAIEDMEPTTILASVRGLAQMLRNDWEIYLLTRFFTTTETLLSTNGYDVGFCDGSGTVQYAPPQWGGQTFAETHNHYVGYNSSTPKTWADMLNGTAKLLNEHGIVGDYKAWVPEADVATITALTAYVRPVEIAGGVIDRGGATSGNQYFVQGEFGATPQMGGRPVGWFNSDYGKIHLYGTYRIATGYCGMYKPGAQGALTNALAVNYRPSFGLGVKVLEIPDWNSTFPLREVDVEMEFGVSCGQNRYAGACGYLVAGGTWVDASIS